MTKRSWYDQRGFFYFLFILIFFIHAGLLIVKFAREMKPSVVESIPEEKTEPIKVKISKEAIEKWRREKKQIVDSEDGDNFSRPKDAAFLSDKNRSFDRQTRAQNLNKFEKAALGNGKVTSNGSKKNTPKKNSKKEIKLSDLGAYEGHPDPFEEAAHEMAKSQKGSRNGDPQSRGVSSTNDFIDDVPLGDLTHLNTQEFKFYGFYHRIRQKLEQFWGRSLHAKAAQMMKGNRRLPASEDMITSLQVTLDAHGEIIAIKIMGPSGIKELDDAAVESFNEAGPFPNPPKDLIVDDQVVLEWGFVVRS